MNTAPQRDGPGPVPSRRDFLRGSGVAAAATALAQPPLVAAEEADQAGKTVAIGPGVVKLTLEVNGARMTTSIEPRVTLLDTLRNYLDVTGCKRVCDRGSCGACTVMLDGKPIYSCSLLALEAQGKSIKTAEALVDGYRAGRLRQARRPAVRLLHARLRRRASRRPRPEPQRDSDRDRGSPVGQRLPLRHL
jgi:hypothetical protein